MILLAITGTFIVLYTDWYLWKKFFRGKGWKSWAWWIPSILLAFFIIGGISGIWHSFMMRGIYFTVLLAEVPKLVFFLFHRLIGKKPALCLAAATILLFFYGMTVGFHHLTVKRFVYESTSVPEAFDGYRIVHLSDLHLGTYTDASTFPARVADSVNALDADLVVFTGDLVNVQAEEALAFKEALSAIKAKDGVLSITGNHDYGFVNSQIEENLEKLARIETEAGWKLLLNEGLYLHRGADSIYVAGVENTSKSFFISRGDLGKAMAGATPGGFKLVLTHDPHHWRDEILPETDANLTLSGHTHAMQFKLFGISPAALVSKEWGGEYSTEDGRAMIVSEGIGGIMPFRIGAYPQIVLVTLQKKK